MSLDTRLALFKAVGLVIANYTRPPELSAPGQVLNGSESCERLRNLGAAVAQASLLEGATPTLQALILRSSAFMDCFVVTETSQGPQQVLEGAETWIRLERLEKAAEDEAEDLVNTKGYSDYMASALRDAEKAQS